MESKLNIIHKSNGEITYKIKKQETPLKIQKEMLCSERKIRDLLFDKYDKQRC